MVKKHPKFTKIFFVTLKLKQLSERRQPVSGNNKNIGMTSALNNRINGKIEMITEVITIEDEIQVISCSSVEDIKELESSSSSEKNPKGGICYFFEPQTSKTTSNNNCNEQKSK